MSSVRPGGRRGGGSEVGETRLLGQTNGNKFRTKLKVNSSMQTPAAINNDHILSNTSRRDL